MPRATLSSIQRDGDGACFGVIVDDFRQLLAREIICGDFSLLYLTFVVDEDDEDLDELFAATHGGSEFRNRFVLEFVEVHNRDHLIFGDLVHVDDGSVRLVVFSYEVLLEAVVYPGETLKPSSRNGQLAVLDADAFSIERPASGVAVATLRRRTGEREALALVERGDESQPKATQLARRLDGLSDAGERLLERLYVDTVAVVGNADSARTQVDAHEDARAHAVDGILDGFDDRQKQRRVGVGQLQQRVTTVKVDLGKVHQCCTGGVRLIDGHVHVLSGQSARSLRAKRA